MPLDPDLVGQAVAAQTRLSHAEHDAEVARAEFHRAVQLLKKAGGSVGEIAAALGLSRQHVHQIVESATEHRSWRKGRPGARELLSCSFCGKHQKQVQKLIAGPGVYICDECVERVRLVLAPTGEVASTPIATIGPVDAADTGEQCGFCGKQRHRVSAMASTDHAAICNECLDLCEEIISEELA